MQEPSAFRHKAHSCCQIQITIKKVTYNSNNHIMKSSPKGNKVDQNLSRFLKFLTLVEFDWWDIPFFSKLPISGRCLLSGMSLKKMQFFYELSLTLRLKLVCWNAVEVCRLKMTKQCKNTLKLYLKTELMDLFHNLVSKFLKQLHFWGTTFTLKANILPLCFAWHFFKFYFPSASCSWLFKDNSPSQPIQYGRQLLRIMYRISQVMSNVFLRLSLASKLYQNTKVGSKQYSLRCWTRGLIISKLNYLKTT